MRNIFLAMFMIFGLEACTQGPKISHPPKLPYDHWYLGFAAPRYMEVWVESADVIDQRGLFFYRVSAGVAGYTRKPEGWHKGGGSTMPLKILTFHTLFPCDGSR